MTTKKNQIKKSLSIIIAMTICAGVGFMAGKIGFTAVDNLPVSVVITLAILFIPAFFLVIGIHELGHVVAGMMVDFECKMFVVGPFFWEKTSTGWRFKWNKNINISGGLALCMPKGKEDLGKKFSIYAAGGPTASLLLSLVAYGVYKIAVSNDDNNIVIQLVAYLHFMIAFLSVVIFASTSIPMHIGGFSSDGARVLRLLKGGDVSRFEILIIKLFSSSSGGVRPGLLDKDELNEALILSQKLNAPFGVYLHSFMHQAALDEGNMELAEMHLKNYIADIALIPEGLRTSVWLDAAFYYAYHKKDLEQAQFYWHQFMPNAMTPKAQIHATEAAMAFLTGDKSLTQTKINLSLHALPEMLDKGLAVALEEKLNFLNNTLRESMSNIDNQVSHMS